MTSVDGNTVIHRKARASREEYQARAMSPAKALRLALAQASDTLFDLAMVVTAVEQVELSQTALRLEFADGGLLVLLDGPKGARGAVRVDAALLAALIEVQTMGRVTGRGSNGRAVTRTDAAIAAPLIDAALSGAEAMLTEDAQGVDGGEVPAHWASGYRFGVMMEDARGMALALHAPAFHVFRMMVEVGDDGHPGAVTFLLPVPLAAPPPAAGAKGGAMQRTLERSAMDAPVSLEAVLARVILPLDKVCKLKPGGLLPFGMDQPMQVRLEASQKHVVALARLGQMNGARAVRLTPCRPEAQADSERSAPRGERANVAVSIDEAAGTPVLDTPGADELSRATSTPQDGGARMTSAGSQPQTAARDQGAMSDKELLDHDTQ
ncbi:FliM/FliN family flagellar motor C-terminal domain-containing protein [Roseovarius sp. Pro17]|uniref:FliM/FliN family flagellar motor C-terminal domain-containing protein n=1 Tax=Roseovarius sp. Pro17 TaxID=3108175 RepID=UPI002D77C6D0|nr:FliM/FliN family flagellar motor C-terminal domain-containing protein [Roseovarius sp. Pro17]